MFLKKFLVLFIAVFLYCPVVLAVENPDTTVDDEIEELERIAALYRDWEPTEFIITPDIPVAKQKIELKIVIRNSGDFTIRDTRGFLTYRVDLDDFVIEDLERSKINNDFPVEPGKEVYYTYTGYFETSGNKDLSFMIDAENQYREWDQSQNRYESNNEYFSSVEVLDIFDHDLVIAEVEVSKDDITLFDDIEITYKVKNITDATLTKPIGILAENRGYEKKQVEYYLPNFIIENYTFSEYPSFETPFDEDDEFEYKFTGYFNKRGESELFFKVDRYNYLQELDETNNSTTTPVYVYSNQREANEFKFIDWDIDFIGTSSARVTWRTTKPSYGHVEYKSFNTFDIYKMVKDIEEWPGVEEEDEREDQLAENSVVINGLEKYTQYQLLFEMVNGVADLTSDVYTFKTPGDLVVEGINTDIDKSNRVATVNWSTNRFTEGELFYKPREIDSYTSVLTVATSTDFSIQLGGLEEDTYEYYIIASTTTNVEEATSTMVSVVSPVKYFSFTKDVEEIEEEIEELRASEEVEDIEKEPLKIITEDIVDEKVIMITNGHLFRELKGRILLKVEDAGEAWYVSPGDAKKYYLGRPRDAYNIMRNLGVGISNKNLAKIQVGDKYVPLSERNKLDYDFAENNKGMIFLQVENNGEAWYVNPVDSKRYYLGKPEDAFRVMRELSTGITNEDFVNL